MDLMKSMNKNGDSKSNKDNGKNDNNGNSNNGYLNSEEENAFLQMEMDLEKEKENENENEKDDENDENENTEKSEFESKVSSNTNDAESSTQIGRNGMEFSLFLDESSDADFYLVLQSGVEKEEKYEIDELASHLPTIDQNNPMITKGDSEEKHSKCGKKNKFGSGYDEVEKEVEDCRNASAKKQKTEVNSIPTHTIFVTENESEQIKYNEMENSVEHDEKKSEITVIHSDSIDKIDSNIEIDIDSDNALEFYKNANSTYDSKYLDIATHKRLSDMFENCTEHTLNSLTLSDRMLTLMGYPGCDGEEGKKKEKKLVFLYFFLFIFYVT